MLDRASYTSIRAYTSDRVSVHKTPPHVVYNANLLRRVGIEGVKKYSPPFETTHSVGIARFALWLFGSVPDIVRDPGSAAWPIIASKPGVTGF